MTDDITLTLDGAEAHIIAAALAVYRRMLSERWADGELFDRIATRAEAKLETAMYPVEDLAAGDFYAGMPA